MATPALPFRLALAGATGLLLLGGIAAAVTVDDSTSPTSSGPPATTGGDNTSTTLAQAGPDESTVLTVPEAPDPLTPTTTAAAGPAAGPATTAAGRGTTTTAGRRATGGAPGPLVAPKVGSYGYDATSTSGGGAPSTTRTAVTVEAAGTDGPATLQDITIPTDQLGQRTNIRSRVAWGPAGAIVSRSQAAGGDCMWQPAWPQYVGDLKVGRSWTYDTRCSVTAPVQATIERRGSRRVTASQTVGVAGTSVATWAIDVDETTVITTPLGVLTLRSVGTEQLAPSLGVPVTKTEALSGTGVSPGSTSSLKLVTLP
ncbi:MAG: hypothetical protein ABIS47_02585 [Acidimicrobiales bacterium]